MRLSKHIARGGLLAALGLAVLVGVLAQRSEPAPDFDAVAWTAPEGRTLWVARHEVTVAEWNACAEAGGCVLRLDVRPGFDPATTPATGISWMDAAEYLAWVNSDGPGHGALRLPTAAEWQAMAEPVLPPPADPVFTDPALEWAASYLTTPSYPRALKPTGSHSLSPEGIADLDGPVWEWTSDCFDGTADPGTCPAYAAGGLHEAVLSVFTRDPAQGGCAVGAPPAHLGLRLVSDRAPTS